MLGFVFVLPQLVDSRVRWACMHRIALFVCTYFDKMVLLVWKWFTYFMFVQEISAHPYLDNLINAKCNVKGKF
jgi:hypothetical protein